MMEGVGISQDFLKGGDRDLVAGCFIIDRVCFCSGLDFESAVFSGIGIIATRGCKFRFGCDIADTVGVCLWMSRERGGFFVDDFVAGAIDGGVYAEGEYMLVVLGQDARVHDCSPGHREARLDRCGGEDTGCTDFVMEFTTLAKDECQDIFIVTNCDDRLEDEFAGASHDCAPCTVIDMFESDSGILLVDANYVGHLQKLTGFHADIGGEIVDCT